MLWCTISLPLLVKVMFIKGYKFILINKYIRISIDNKLKMYDVSLIHKFKTYYNNNLRAIQP